eukprot:5199240-Amphidinium_carterae.1
MYVRASPEPVAAVASSSITDLSQQHYPAFYHEGISTDEPLQLGTCWPSTECDEDEIMQPHHSAYMVHAEQLEQQPHQPSASAASASADMPGFSSTESTAILNLPLTGHVAVSGTVQLRLPQHLIPHVVAAQVHTSTTASPVYEHPSGTTSHEPAVHPPPHSWSRD